MNIQRIRDEVAYSRICSRQDAARSCGSGGILRSRGAWLTSANAGGRCQPFDEPVEWRGYGGQLIEAATRCIEAGATKLYLEGGWDHLTHVGADDYDPCVSEWDLLIWSADRGWID